MAKSKLHGSHLIKAIDMWVVTVVKYNAGILDWRDHELKTLAIKTRRILPVSHPEIKI